jgi:GT2 family glycosyltransferase
MEFSQTQKPRITIAIPYYSGLDFLRLAIESLLRQTNSDWLCIVVDDRGGESAEDLVREFCSDKIRYVSNQTTLGLSANWNRAVELAETPLITIFHADDLMGETFIENTLNAFSQNPDIAATHCRARLIDYDGKTIKSIAQKIKDLINPRGTKNEILLSGNSGLCSLTFGDWIICPTLTYRTEVVQKLKFNTDLRFATDLEFLARLLFADLSILSRPAVDYSYRVHRNSQTTKMQIDGHRFLEEWAVISWIGRISRLRGWSRTSVVANSKPILRSHILFAAFSLLRQFQFRKTMMLLGWALFKPPKEKMQFALPKPNQH